MPNRKLEITQDGSHTVYDSHIRSHFHSIFGAIMESKHVFIQHGLEYFQNSKSVLKIFELGFGTGLNAYLSFLNPTTRNNSIKIYYHAIDSNPLSIEIAKGLNYPQLLSAVSIRPHLLEFHTCEWNRPHALDVNFYLHKMNCDWQSFRSEEKYDLVYFDAFDPVSQPELWTISTFEKLYSMMSQNSILCTYCAKGIVRRNLKEVGFKIESLPGPPGKREMTRAYRL